MAHLRSLSAGREKMKRVALICIAVCVAGASVVAQEEWRRTPGPHLTGATLEIQPTAHIWHIPFEWIDAP